MEGTPRLAERGRSPFKPQTVLLDQMPSVVFESYLAKPRNVSRVFSGEANRLSSQARDAAVFLELNPNGRTQPEK
jgi:hypothetical protein